MHNAEAEKPSKREKPYRLPRYRVKARTALPPFRLGLTHRLTETLFQPHLAAVITEGWRIEYPEGGSPPLGTPRDLSTRLSDSPQGI